jgi:hypothetical protein
MLGDMNPRWIEIEFDGPFSEKKVDQISTDYYDVFYVWCDKWADKYIVKYLGHSWSELSDVIAEALKALDRKRMEGSLTQSKKYLFIGRVINSSQQLTKKMRLDAEAAMIRGFYPSANKQHKECYDRNGTRGDITVYIRNSPFYIRNSPFSRAREIIINKIRAYQGECDVDIN